MSLKKLLLIPLVTLTLLALGLIYFNINNANTAVKTTETITFTTQAEWQEKIQECAPKAKNATLQMYYDYNSDECLEQIMIAAYENKNIELMSKALQEEVNEDTNLYLVCHPSAHTAGLKALEFNNNVETMLEEAAKSTVCDWGMGHGILDALAETKPSIEQFNQVSNWCDKQKNDLRLYSLCVDGLGHVAWGGTNSFEEAVKWCDNMNDPEGRSMCGGGIVMQKYAPASGKNAEKPLDLHEDLVKLCTEWENYVTAEGALNGCFAGAAYMYGVDLVTQLNKAWWEGSSDSPTKLTKETEESIYKVFKESLTKCESYTSDIDGVCQKSLANQIPIKLTLENREVHENLCKLLDDEGALGNCTRGLGLKLE